MSKAQTHYQLQVPATLETQLLDFRRRVWTAKMLEATGVAAVSVVVAFLCIFVLDRLWNTPSWLRWGVFLAALAGCATAPLYLHRWIWRYRSLEQLARLLSRKLPRVGDQLLGIIELAHSESEQARSRMLCEAAIVQVAEDAEKRDFRDATPTSHDRLWVGLAVAAIAVVACLFGFFPSAAQNAWARFVAPWNNLPRYTFAAVDSLPKRLIVAHGESFTLVAGLGQHSLWRPPAGYAQIGNQRPVEAGLKDDHYAFELPPQIEDGWLNVRIGDSSQLVHVEPKMRPELSTLLAHVTLPDYLGRPEPVQTDVRGGAITLVKGSRATFAATTTRSLSAAWVDDQPRQPAGSTVSSEEIALDAPRQMSFIWRDEFGLAGKAPFKLSAAVRDDDPPSITCEGLPQRKVVLDSEQLVFQVKAQDDFGVKHVGMEWRGVSKEAVDVPAAGERMLGAGGHDKISLELAATFTATSLGIEPQPIELRAFAEDYYPGRPRVYSPAYLLYVLNSEQHAIWVTEQLSKWHRQSLEVRDRELQLYEVNKQLRGLSSEELDQPETRRRIENQASAERANARRLSSLTMTGEDLLREAARNPEIGVGHLEKWAEMLKILKDISGNRMPSVADLLKEAAQARNSVAKVPNNTPKAVGQIRSSGSLGGAKNPDEAKKLPIVPGIVDTESSQQPVENAAGQAAKKSPAAPSLRLPTTTFAGKSSAAPPPPDKKMDQAVAEQKDLLAEFERIADELDTVLANLEGSTLAKRLKAASRLQYRVAGRISDRLDETLGVSPLVLGEERNRATAELAKEEVTGGHAISVIMDDMQAYFERRRLVQFKTVLDDMRSQDVLGALRRLADDLPVERGLSISQCEYWSDTMDRWAEDLVDPARSGACPGCRSRGSLPPSIVLEVLQILEAEINLREETRVAEQAKSATEPDPYRAEAQRLSDSQSALDKRVVKVIERILELPDAEAEFAYEIKLLHEVSTVMDEAQKILSRPETGSAAIAAETDVIELLLKSRRMKPGGGGGGSSPGGGSGGPTDDAALALLGAGLNEKEVRQDHGVSQSIGQSGPSLPEEFRAGLDEYFNRLERPENK